MGRIRVLDAVLSNQIAAGEVVERPSSVIKELMENAVDAGATTLTVELTGGGVQLLRVVDNGHGMSRDDAVLALQRHATSKLKTVADLDNIHTLGFRGEAMPSIASVSRMSIRTREPDALGATRVEIEGGEVKVVRDAPGPVGTEIVVEDLFFNVPARRKFLKKMETEASHVQEAVQRLALCYPEVAIKFVKEGRVSLNLPPASDLRARVSDLFGRKVARGLEPVSVPGAFGLDGLIGPPSEAKGTARHYHVFINGRYIRDRVIISAIQSGYGSSLQRGRHPFVVLRLQVPPQAVDVNVHPAKTEVRFVDSSAMHRLVGRAIDGCVRRNPWAASGPEHTLEHPPAPLPEPSAYRLETRQPEPEGGVAAHRRRIFDAMEKLTARRHSVSPGRPASSHHGAPSAYGSQAPPSTSGLSRQVFSPSSAMAESHGPTVKAPVVCLDDFDALNEVPFERLEQVAMIGPYAIFSAVDGLVYLHVPGAWQAVAYDRIRRAQSPQSLSRPVTMDMQPREATALLHLGEALVSLGFEVEPFGGTTFVVKSLPFGVSREAAAGLIQETLKFGDGVDTSLFLTEASRYIAKAVSAELSERSLRELLQSLASLDFDKAGAPGFIGRLSVDDLGRGIQ